MTMIGRAAPAQDGGRTRTTVRVGVAGSLVGAVLLGAIMAVPWGCRHRSRHLPRANPDDRGGYLRPRRALPDDGG